MRPRNPFGKRGSRVWRTAAFVFGLGLGLAGSLQAELGGRLAVLAHALAASGVARGHGLILQAANSAEAGLAPGQAQALDEGLRAALVSVPGLRLRPAGAAPKPGDRILVPSTQAQDGGVQLTLALQEAGGSSSVWSRSASIDYADLPPGPEPGAAAPNAEAMEAGSGQASTVPSLGQDAAAGGGDGEAWVVPTLPGYDGPRRTRRVGPRRPFHWDVSAAYQSFFPLNSTFQGVAGSRQDALSLGLSFQDIVLMDMASWHADVNGPGTLQSLDYYGVDFALVAPWHLGPLTLYAGPGGRFGSIELNDSSLPQGSVGYGNNGLLAVAGAKLKAGPVGVDLRYNYDLVASYTGYHSVRLGAFYEFGR